MNQKNREISGIENEAMNGIHNMHYVIHVK